MATSSSTPRFSEVIPEGDDRLRKICDNCGFIDYRNPRIVVGSVAVRDGAILMCRRAISPRRGFWTLPAGFMELGEDVVAGAEREAFEEACAAIRVTSLIGVYSIPHIGQVHMMFSAELLSDIAAGPESTEVAMMAYEDIPWDQIAFPTVGAALRDWRSRTSAPLPHASMSADPAYEV
jgi:ADP-ribose pyrophosphatase YjhB (NUDIX family)